MFGTHIIPTQTIIVIRSYVFTFFPQPPTFSLGLTQELRLQDPDVGDEEEGNGAARFTEKEDEAEIGRKSKRVRVVPFALVNDYQCGGDILSRAWEGLMAGAPRYESSVLQTKYTKLATLLKDSW